MPEFPERQSAKAFCFQTTTSQVEWNHGHKQQQAWDPQQTGKLQMADAEAHQKHVHQAQTMIAMRFSP